MFEYAKNRFDKFISDNFDIKNDIVERKVTHTYNVVKMAEYIATDLKLSEEDKELAKLIALLHDIGRFLQAKEFNNLLAASKKVDHAALGAKLLFENNFIREFVKDDSFDNIIKLAILNHNKYELTNNNFTDRQLLHCRLIRDADKTDNYRVKSTANVNSMAGITKEEIENSFITDKVYKTFMSKRTIFKNDRKTAIDIWISYIAFIFDLNFSSSLKYIKENDYINILVNRFDYKNNDTKEKMEYIRNFANDFVNDFVNDHIENIALSKGR